MQSALDWIQRFAIGMGGPGLFLVAFLDSSFLSLPEINDLLVIWMVTQHEQRMVYYALMATLGSVVGCFLLYGIGKKGGEAVLRKRFHERHVDRALELYRRYGLLVVLVPALLPPPAPFKIFVLLAGIAGVRPLHFGLAVGIGRGARYFGEGLLAVWYGDRALEFLQANGKAVSIGLAVAVAGATLAYLLWRNRPAAWRHSSQQDEL